MGLKERTESERVTCAAFRVFSLREAIKINNSSVTCSF